MKPTFFAVSYNAHKGFSGMGKRFTLSEIREQLRRLHPHFVFLQEVHGEHRRKARQIHGWPESSQPEYLADGLWPHFRYGKNAVYTDGDHGNAILSQYPIISSENIDLSLSRIERRGLLHAVIELPRGEGRLHALCVHLGLFARDRRKQLERIAERIEKHVPAHEPLILAGDFNDWRGTGGEALIEHGLREVFLDVQGRYARSFPSGLPLVPLDRIYYRGFDPIAGRCLSGRPWSSLSDHSPLEAELRLSTRVSDTSSRTR